MNMIPLVMANEPGYAQAQSRNLLRNAALRNSALIDVGASLFGRKQQRG